MTAHLRRARWTLDTFKRPSVAIAWASVPFGLAGLILDWRPGWALWAACLFVSGVPVGVIWLLLWLDERSKSEDT
jgi:hypothetical protein